MKSVPIRPLIACALSAALLLPAAHVVAQGEGALDLGPALNNLAKDAIQKYRQGHRSDEQVLRDFGTSLLKTAPEKVRNGTTIDKAQYAFREYCKKLNEGMVPVNASYQGRALQLFADVLRTPGRILDGERIIPEASAWTCGDHSQKLEALFQGMGIDPNEIVEMQTGGHWYDLTSARDHGALLVRGEDGKLYIFDAWYLAVSNAETVAYNNKDLNLDPDKFPLYNCDKFP